MGRKKTIDLIIEAATNFHNELCDDPNGRFRSWEHCYKRFYDARKDSKPDMDYLCLHLAFYLASWGMYRGSSFLLQKDYKVHKKIVEEILKPKYDCLFGIKCSKYRDEDTMNLLMELYGHIKDHYKDIRRSVKGAGLKSEPSSVLVTKVLMGTLGCVPAYDRYFVDGVKEQGVSTGNFTPKSLLKLVDFYEDNQEELEKVRKGLKVYGLQYPQMKMLDMGFWKRGYDLDPKNKSKKPH